MTSISVPRPCWGQQGFPELCMRWAVLFGLGVSSPPLAWRHFSTFTTQYHVPLPSPSGLAPLLNPKPTSASELSSRNYTDLKQERTVGDGTPAAKQDKCLAALPLLHNQKKKKRGQIAARLLASFFFLQDRMQESPGQPRVPLKVPAPLNDPIEWLKQGPLHSSGPAAKNLLPRPWQLPVESF